MGLEWTVAPARGRGERRGGEGKGGNGRGEEGRGPIILLYREFYLKERLEKGELVCGFFPPKLFVEGVKRSAT